MNGTIAPVKPYHEMTADELMAEANRVEDSAFELPPPKCDEDEKTPLGKAILALHFRRYETAFDLRRRAELKT